MNLIFYFKKLIIFEPPFLGIRREDFQVLKKKLVFSMDSSKISVHDRA